MPLSPVPLTTSPPSYPARKRESLRKAWLRKTLSAAAVALALGMTACSGGPGGELPFGPDVGLGGVAEEPWPAFYCAAEEPVSPPELAGDGYFTGTLCGEETAWAVIPVSAAGVYQLRLSSGVDQAVVAFYNPEGEQIAQLDGDSGSLNVEMTAGSWLVSATPFDIDGYPYSSFEVSIQRL